MDFACGLRRRRTCWMLGCVLGVDSQCGAAWGGRTQTSSGCLRRDLGSVRDVGRTLSWLAAVVRY